MNTRIALTSAALLGMLAVGANVGHAQDVTITVAPGVDLSNYRLFRWVTIDGAGVPDEALDRQIKGAFEAALGSKGVNEAGFDFAGQRSLYIVYQLAVKQPEQWKVYSSEGAQWIGGPASSTTATISVGALQLDMYDPATKKLVWQGRATNTLPPTVDPKERQARLNKAVAKLLEDFPPKVKR
jgi:hypothetical protein